MRRVILAIVATAAALVLLLSFKTHTQSAATGGSPAAALGSPTPGAGSAGTGGGTGTGGDAGATSTAGSTAVPAGPGKTVTGKVWPTIYGPVQVRITVAGGRITAASALEYPVNTPRDQQINAFAIPQLNQEAVTAGSAKIDAVSGATYTSGGYIGSLQSALDQLNGA
jgi:FMN-binding domain